MVERKKGRYLDKPSSVGCGLLQLRSLRRRACSLLERLHVFFNLQSALLRTYYRTISLSTSAVGGGDQCSQTQVERVAETVFSHA